MRQQHLLLTTALTIALAYTTACRDAAATAALPESTTAVPLDNPDTTGAIGYELQLPQSIIKWRASHVVGGGHEGTLNLLSGNLAADATGKWVGGYFEIDMNTIRITDLKEGERGGVEKHLKDDDFFAVQKHPRAYFLFTQAIPSGNNAFAITGNLTLKGITQSITFPATLEPAGDLVRGRASLRINRTRWGVNYQSGSIFSSLKDDIIEDMIPVTLELVFRKK